MFGVEFESIRTVLRKLESRKNARIAVSARRKPVETFLGVHGEIIPLNRKTSV